MTRSRAPQTTRRASTKLVDVANANASRLSRWERRAACLDYIAKEVASGVSMNCREALVEVRERHGRAIDVAAFYALRRHAWVRCMGSAPTYTHPKHPNTEGLAGAQLTDCETRLMTDVVKGHRGTIEGLVVVKFEDLTYYAIENPGALLLDVHGRCQRSNIWLEHKPGVTSLSLSDDQEAKAETPSPRPEPKLEHCVAVARSTGSRCRNFRRPDSALCNIHRNYSGPDASHRPEEAPQADGEPVNGEAPTPTSPARSGLASRVSCGPEPQQLEVTWGGFAADAEPPEEPLISCGSGERMTNREARAWPFGRAPEKSRQVREEVERREAWWAQQVQDVKAAPRPIEGLVEVRLRADAAISTLSAILATLSHLTVETTHDDDGNVVIIAQ